LAEVALLAPAWSSWDLAWAEVAQEAQAVWPSLLVEPLVARALMTAACLSMVAPEKPHPESEP